MTNKLLTICSVAIGLMGIIAPAHSEEASISMLTWRGDTAAETAFKETMNASEFKINWTEFNANRDRTALASYLRSNADSLRSQDLVYTFGTTVTKTVKSFGVNGVPHVFNIVADPVGTQIVKSLESTGGPITGAKNTAPLSAIASIIADTVDFDKAAILFDPRESNAETQAEEMYDLLTSQGKTATRVRFVPDASNIDQQIASIKSELSGVGMVYIPAVSSFVGKLQPIADALGPNTVAVGALEAYVGKGATMAISTDYAERGRAAAELALAVLRGTKPSLLSVNAVKAEDAIVVVSSSDPRSNLIKLDKVSGLVKKVD